MDGEIKAIVIKRGGRDGKIIGRCLIKFLPGDEHNPRVLLLERFIPKISETSSFGTAIKKWAIQKATDLGTPLVSKEVGSGPLYEGTVQSFGGFAPYSYSDTLSSGVTSGPFDIKGLHTLS
jgi:hypothetical protein